MRFSRSLRLLATASVIAASAFGLAACGSSSEVSVADPWARTSAGDQSMGAAYMVITGGDEADRLVGAAAPTSIAATTEIHETVMAEASSGEDMEGMDEGEGEMTMRPVDGIDIPAEGTVTLEPGGYHVMLIDLAKPLAAGETFDLTLTFENAGEQVVTVTVRDA